MKRAVIWLPAVLVAVGAGATTAHGLWEVAVAARVPVVIAWLYPLITDGLALVAYAATTRLDRGGARYAWLVVVMAAGLSGLAQAAYLAGATAGETSAELRFGVGAWPAIAAAIVAHLLYLLASHQPAAEPSDELAHDDTPELSAPTDPSPGPIESPSSIEDRAAALLAGGAGRPRLRTELGISDHQARQLVDQHRASTNGAVR